MQSAELSEENNDMFQQRQRSFYATGLLRQALHTSPGKYPPFFWIYYSYRANCTECTYQCFSQVWKQFCTEWSFSNGRSHCWCLSLTLHWQYVAAVLKTAVSVCVWPPKVQSPSGDIPKDRRYKLYLAPKHCCCSTEDSFERVWKIISGLYLDAIISDVWKQILTL